MAFPLIDYFDIKKHEEEFANIYITSSDDKKLIFHKCILIKNKWIKDNLLDGSVNTDDGIRFPFLGYTINAYLNWLSNSEFKKAFNDSAKYSDDYLIAKDLYKIAHFINDTALQNECLVIMIGSKQIDNDLVDIYKKFKLHINLLYDCILNGNKYVQLVCDNKEFMDECVIYGVNGNKHIDIMLRIIPYYRQIDGELYDAIVNFTISDGDKKCFKFDNMRILITGSHQWIADKSGSKYLAKIARLLFNENIKLREENDEYGRRYISGNGNISSKLVQSIRECDKLLEDNESLEEELKKVQKENKSHADIIDKYKRMVEILTAEKDDYKSKFETVIKNDDIFERMTQLTKERDYYLAKLKEAREERDTNANEISRMKGGNRDKYQVQSSQLSLEKDNLLKKQNELQEEIKRINAIKDCYYDNWKKLESKVLEYKQTSHIAILERDDYKMKSDIMTQRLDCEVAKINLFKSKRIGVTRIVGDIIWNYKDYIWTIICLIIVAIFTICGILDTKTKISSLIH